MSKRKKYSATSDQVDNVLGIIEQALRSTGCLLPENEDDVRRSESRIDIEKVSLPNLLRDPVATLARGKYVLKNGLSSDLSPENSTPNKIQQDLRRAARNGGSISDEIQARMQKDRAAASKKLKNT